MSQSIEYMVIKKDNMSGGLGNINFESAEGLAEFSIINVVKKKKVVEVIKALEYETLQELKKHIDQEIKIIEGIRRSTRKDKPGRRKERNKNR